MNCAVQQKATHNIVNQLYSNKNNNNKEGNGI